MKIKTIYTCQQCGFSSPKWLGKCPDCESWNSFVEDAIAINNKSNKNTQGIKQVPTPIQKIDKFENRTSTDIEELDRVLGGGFVKGSLTLLSGEPGIGKSTLTLKICEALSKKINKILYISGEESVQQIALRAERLNINSSSIQLLSETNLENALATINDYKPDLVIIDSIQVISSSTIDSFGGSISQVRYCTERVMEFSKNNNISTILIGHVNKDGNLAGPKVLEHLVDTVLLIEGDRYNNLRILRTVKNRFGSTNEVGIFEMEENGLNEVNNPSKLFIDERKPDAFGYSITATIEGTRPILIEVQALTNYSVFGYPKRTASGFDINRLQLLIAVLQKHLQLNLSNQDVYVNIVGGYKLNDPGADLAIAMAIISSYTKTPLPEKAVYFGEIGLSGEIRTVQNTDKRIQEAQKVGMTDIYLKADLSKLKTRFDKIKLNLLTDLQSLKKNFLFSNKSYSPNNQNTTNRTTKPSFNPGEMPEDESIRTDLPF